MTNRRPHQKTVGVRRKCAGVGQTAVVAGHLAGATDDSGLNDIKIRIRKDSAVVANAWLFLKLLRDEILLYNNKMFFLLSDG